MEDESGRRNQFVAAAWRKRPSRQRVLLLRTSVLRAYQKWHFLIKEGCRYFRALFSLSSTAAEHNAPVASEAGNKARQGSGGACSASFVLLSGGARKRWRSSSASRSSRSLRRSSQAGIALFPPAARRERICRGSTVLYLLTCGSEGSVSVKICPSSTAYLSRQHMRALCTN